MNEASWLLKFGVQRLNSPFRNRCAQSRHSFLFFFYCCKTCATSVEHRRVGTWGRCWALTFVLSAETPICLATPPRAPASRGNHSKKEFTEHHTHALFVPILRYLFTGASVPSRRRNAL